MIKLTFQFNRHSFRIIIEESVNTSERLFLKYVNRLQFESIVLTIFAPTAAFEYVYI